MSILQKISTGWDQNIVDELVTSPEEWFGDTVLAMLQRIEDTLDAEDTEINLRSLVEGLETTINDMSEEISTLEQQLTDAEAANYDLRKEYHSVTACNAGAEMKLNEALVELGRYKT